MAKPVRKSLPRQIADMIEEKIRSGVYQVGDKLPTEPTLVEQLGVSRNTVREAIQSLTHSGLLETRQGDGTYVVATEKLQVEFFNIMSGTTYQNVLEVRDLLEKHIVISAIRNCSDADIQSIGTALARRRLQTASIRDATQADLDFHMAIAKSTHNEIIFNIYRYVSEYFNQFIYTKLKDREKIQSDIDQVHDDLFQAIRDRNVESALDCVNRIIES